MGVRAGRSGCHGTMRKFHYEHERTGIERGLRRYEESFMMHQWFKKTSKWDDVSVGAIYGRNGACKWFFLFPDGESTWSAYPDEVEKKGCPHGVTRTWTVKAVSRESG